MRSKVWRPAAAARNRAPGGPGHRPPGIYDPAARSSLHGIRRKCRRRKRGPRPKIATVERREARLPPAEVGYIRLRPRIGREARHLARCLARYVTAGCGCPLAPERLSALRPPLDWGWNMQD